MVINPTFWDGLLLAHLQIDIGQSGNIARAIVGYFGQPFSQWHILIAWQRTIIGTANGRSRKFGLRRRQTKHVRKQVEACPVVELSTCIELHGVQVGYLPRLLVADIKNIRNINAVNQQSPEDVREIKLPSVVGAQNTIWLEFGRCCDLNDHVKDFVLQFRCPRMNVQFTRGIDVAGAEAHDFTELRAEATELGQVSRNHVDCHVLNTESGVE